jgi:hypothetical protein
LDIISIPLKVVSIVILRVGGLLISATGGEASSSESVQVVLIRLILIAIFCFNSFQYSTQIAAFAASISWLPVWGGFVIGAILNAITQLLQARVLRKDVLAKKEAAFGRVARARISEDQMEGLVDVAQAKARQYNRSEMLKLQVMGVFAAGAWAIEFFIMASSPIMTWAKPWFNFANIPTAILTVIFSFAFEVFAQMDEEV